MKAPLRQGLTYCFAISLISCLTYAAFHTGCEGDAVAQSTHQRALRVFNYDHSHQNRLPTHRLVALSVALEFHNHSGATEILDELEPYVR